MVSETSDEEDELSSSEVEAGTGEDELGSSEVEAGTAEEELGAGEAVCIPWALGSCPSEGPREVRTLYVGRLQTAHGTRIEIDR